MANRTQENRSSTNQSNSGDGNSSDTRSTSTSTSMTRSGESSRSGNATTSMMPYGWLPTPLDFMSRLTNDLGRLFTVLDQLDAGSPASLTPRTPSRRASWTPAVEITTRGNDLVIQTDLPGVKPEDVQVEVDNNNIIIKGESRYEQEKKEGDFLYTERSYGAFYRSIPLPQGVNTDNAHAQFNGSALEIVLPGGAKVLAPSRRPIKVEMSQQGTQQTERSRGLGQSQQSQQEQTHTASTMPGDQQATSHA